MSTVTIKLIQKEEIANETMAFTFEKPIGFEYKAGQSADFTIINPPETDAEGNRRTFTLASAPFEEHLMIATRMRDTAFKRTLKKMSLGSEVKLEGPFGDFVLPQTIKPVVFLTGGIGITTVRSIVAQGTFQQLPHPITLLYSNKTEADTAFLSELQQLATKNPHFTLVPVMTRATPEEWSGERGHITVELLKQYIPDLTSPTFYLSGPTSMVKAMRQILSDAAVNPDSIKTEEYSGY